MRIRRMIVKNFRSIIDCDFDFGNLVVLLGENNCGKSNVLAAIELFLKKTKANGEFDFNNKNNPIEIEVTFGDLTDFEKNKLKNHIENDELIIKISANPIKANLFIFKCHFKFNITRFIVIYLDSK